MEKEDSFSALIVLGQLIVTAVLTTLGRIYFPDNFTPDKVSWIENFIILNIGITFVGLLLVICVFCLWFFTKEVIREIKNLFNRY
jgi:uncharacterized BrkB/YihY/UPF0761 family membrane protein